MKNRFLITNDEKSRILSLHESVKPHHGTSVYNNSLLTESKQKEKNQIKKELGVEDEGMFDKVLDNIEKFGDRLSKMTPETAYKEFYKKMDELKSLPLSEQQLFDNPDLGGGGGGVYRGSARGPLPTANPSSASYMVKIIGPLVGLLSLGKVYEYIVDFWSDDKEEQEKQKEQVNAKIEELGGEIAKGNEKKLTILSNLFK